MASERAVAAVLTKVRGIVEAVGEESLTLRVDPWEIEVLLPEHARRALQSRVGGPLELHTLFYIEGGAMVARLAPRLIGFLSPIDREFFEIFCSVDGVGARKALRAMSRPVRDLARMIQDQDVPLLATFPGIGEAMAERIVAKLRRKVGKFALIVGGPGEGPNAEGNAREGAQRNGEPESVEPDVLRDTFAALLSVGHSESQARQAIDQVLAGRKKRFKSAAELIEAIYQQNRE